MKLTSVLAFFKLEDSWSSTKFFLNSSLIHSYVVNSCSSVIISFGFLHPIFVGFRSQSSCVCHGCAYFCFICFFAFCCRNICPFCTVGFLLFVFVVCSCMLQVWYRCDQCAIKRGVSPQRGGHLKFSSGRHTPRLLWVFEVIVVTGPADRSEEETAEGRAPSGPVV